MRTTIAIATFLVVGAGAIGVSARPNIKGSDTLKELTQQVIATDPTCGGTIGGGTNTYLGTGSGNGESAILARTQDVAPMSRFLNPAISAPSASAAICTDAKRTEAEGIVFALDGVSVLTSALKASACNGAVADCDPATDPGAGLAYSTTVTTSAGNYTFASWQDVLKVIYTGIHNTASGIGTDCNSPVRQYIAAHYASLFQGACAECSVVSQGRWQQTGTSTLITFTTGVQHAFRRNDESGTTDVFLTLIGAPSVGQGNGNTQPLVNSTSPFCNAHTNNEALPAPVVAGSVDPPWDKPVPLGTSLNANPYFKDLQDWDPIRRTCMGPSSPGPTLRQEDVCSARGDLGLVLPVWDAPLAGTTPNSGFEGPSECNAFTPNVPAVRTALFSGVTGASCTGDNVCTSSTVACPAGSTLQNVSGTSYGCFECPNGETPSSTRSCRFPVLKVGATLSYNCLKSRIRPVPGTTEDGRVFALHALNPSSNAYLTTPRATTTGSPLTISMVGAYYRIHEVDVMAGAAGAACKQDSATDQMGCLTAASPCSFGYAGREAGNQPGALRLKANQIDPEPTCIQNLLSFSAAQLADPANPPATLYPISRKLFVNTVIGYGAAGGVGSTTPAADSHDELKLASCFGNPNPSSTVQTLVDSLGFVRLGPVVGGVASATPFCQDFDEIAACAASGTNSDACANNPDTTDNVAGTTFAGGNAIPSKTVPAP